jgi:hypothetical protein
LEHCVDGWIDKQERQQINKRQGQGMKQMKEELGQRQKVELEVVEGQLVFCAGKELAPSSATLGTRDVEILAWTQATSVSS